MNITSFWLSLLIFSSSGHAGEIECSKNLNCQLEEKIRAAVVEQISPNLNDAEWMQGVNDPATAQDLLASYSRNVASEGMLCFNEAAKSMPEEDVEIFKGVLVGRQDIFKSEGWSSAASAGVESHYGIKPSNLQCSDKTAAAVECKVIRSYLNVAVNLYPILSRCLAQSAKETSTRQSSRK